MNLKVYSNKLLVKDKLILSKDGRVVNSCLAASDIIIPDSVTEIGWFAFENCRSLQSIIISDNVKEMEHDAFWDCKSLQSINVPRGNRQRLIKMLGKEYASKIKEIDL